MPPVGHDTAPALGPRRRKRHWWGGREAPWSGVHRTAAFVVIAGLAATGGLTAASRINYLHNETHLAKLQASLTASSLAVAPADVQQRLGNAVRVAATSADAAALFRRSLQSSLASSAGPFTSVELFRIVAGTPQIEASLGAPPLAAPQSSGTASLLTQASRTGSLAVRRIVAAHAQRLGYAISAAGAAGAFVAYAEQALPASRRVSLPKGSLFNDLNYAIYFGPAKTPAALLETNASHLPLSGTTAVATIPFGTASLTLWVSPRRPLAGTFAEYVAWGIAAVGVLMTLAGAWLAERLIRRREAAESLAEDNQRLYHAQRGISESLQQSLLPQRLAERPQLELAVRYLPGTEGIDVGGDWYDVIDIDPRRVFFTVGDVAGRGLKAATLMASLRNSINAYAAEGTAPEGVLAKASRLLDVGRDGRFATVVCGVIDVETGEATIANAGHPAPALVESGECHLVTTSLGPPLGVDGEYSAVTVAIPPGSTLLAFTDGLIERRRESLSTGLQRLCEAAAGGGALDALLDGLLGSLVPSGPSDDIALLGIRWRGKSPDMALTPVSTSEKNPARPW